jgi:2-dehydropantoate 2-reductase
MRFVVYGAGGVGGVVGGRLAQHGHDVALIARGAHYEAIFTNGLVLESPDDVQRLSIPVFEHPSRISWSPSDVVLLAMKSQDTLAALDALASAAPFTTPIVCLQNGVVNEPAALRRFRDVYGVFVYCATGHLAPGVAKAWYSPITGILDIGRYPSGMDRTALEIAEALRSATFHAEVRPDIMRWKYRKLLMNLGNAVEALCGPVERGNSIVSAAREEGTACLIAAGLAFASDDEAPVRREKELKLRPIGPDARPGGSTWQSLARHTPTTEVDYLNGEVVLMGRTLGIPTPVNETLQRLMTTAVRDGAPPGSLSVETVTGLIERHRS